jgi:hypothetical protein
VHRATGEVSRGRWGIFKMQMMKRGFTILYLRVNGKACTGSTLLFQRRRSSRLNHRSGTSCFRCSGTSEGPTFEHYQAEGETVNSEGCRALLTDELKPATHTKRKRRLSQTVIFYSTTMPFRLRLTRHMRPTEIWNMNSWNILLTVQT